MNSGAAVIFKAKLKAGKLWLSTGLKVKKGCRPISFSIKPQALRDTINGLKRELQERLDRPIFIILEF